MSFQPSAPVRPLESALKPKLFLDKVEDQTGGVAVWSLKTGNIFLPFNAPFADTLRQALELEFSRMQAPLVESAAQADAILNVRATEADTAGEGNVSLTLTVVDRNGRLLWSKRLKGQNSTGQSDNDAAMSGALADALARIGPTFETENVVPLILAAPASAGFSPLAGGAVRTDIDELPAARSFPRPGAHAVVVGVRTYRQKLPEAEFADSDARLVARYLGETLGYQDENVATLINEQASRSDFEKYFERWLPNRVEKGDEVFVYYSGAGAPNPATGEAYLVPYDGDPAYLKQTGYPLARLWAALAKLPARKVTVVMDAGFSGAGGRSVIAKGAKPLVSVVQREDVPGNVAFLSAAAGDQVARSYPEKGHGLFTYFFLKGVKETAKGGDLDLKSVFDYAAAQVTKVARKQFNDDQAPQWGGAAP